jgi:hypothetical protein
MNLKRLAITVFLASSALKAALIIIWRVSRLPVLGLLLTKYDPAAFYVAERTTPIFFDQKRLFPGAGEGLFFEVVLTLAFGIECLVIACIVWWFLRSLRQSRRLADTGRPLVR